MAARALAALPPGSVLPGVRSREPLHPGRFLERHYLKPLALTAWAPPCTG